MNVPFGTWGTQTFIAGLTHNNLIAPWVTKGAMDGEAFAAYIREVFAPEFGARTFAQMFTALAEICDLFSPQECRSYFCEAGYGSG